MNMLEKIQSRLEHLSKSERKVAEVILATPAQAFIQALRPWRWKLASANRPLTVLPESGNPRLS
jgi:phage gpG-like protein